MTTITIELLFVLLMILFNGALAMSEIGVVSSRKPRLEQMASEPVRLADARSGQAS
jgi:putative hemolysin